MKTTLVIGASENPTRYAYLAIRRLRAHQNPVKAVGLKKGKVDDVEIQTGHPVFSDIETVTLYVGPKNQQEELQDYIISLKPRRVIFNPGTENYAFEKKLDQHNIEPVEACTLVLLSTNQY